MVHRTGRRAIAEFRRFGRRWVEHRHTDNAAALAFYALISMVPLLLIGVTVAGMLLGEKAAHGELERQLTTVVGGDLADTVEEILRSASIAPRSEPAGFVIAMLTLFYAGSHVLSKLRATLNVVNEAAPADPARRWLGRLAARCLCAVLILVFGLLLAIGTVINAITAYVAVKMDAPWFAEVQPLGWVSSYLLLVFAFTLILKVLPRRRPWFRNALAGAAFAAAVTASLKGVLDLYFSYSMWGSFIGGGLNFLLFLFWLFISIQAFLAGAEIAAALGRRRRNEGVPPVNPAVPHGNSP